MMLIQPEVQTTAPFPVLITGDIYNVIIFYQLSLCKYYLKNY